MKTITEKEFYSIPNKERRIFTGIIKSNDDNAIAYIKNGKFHREDGPAYERLDGFKLWYFEGELHRLDGPAKIRSNGLEEYWINGRQLTKLEWIQQTPMFKDLMEYKNLCIKHKFYKAIHEPKNTTKHPNGCKKCWEIYKSKHKIV